MIDRFNSDYVDERGAWEYAEQQRLVKQAAQALNDRPFFFADLQMVRLAMGKVDRPWTSVGVRE